MSGKSLKDWVGCEVKGWYPAPAVTCFSNGCKVRYEGKVIGVTQHRYLGDCLTIKSYDGEFCAKPGEFTHCRNLGGWYRVNPEREE